MIPTEEQCLELQEKYNMLSNIKKHSSKVKELIVFVVTELNKKGYNFNLDLMKAVALLHDITKTHQIVMIALKNRDKEWFFNHSHLISSSYKDIVLQYKELDNKLNLQGKLSHVLSGKKLISDLGYKEIGEIIGQHDKPLTDISSASILCYCDRRVNGNKLVTLDQRFEYLQMIYGEDLVNFLKNKTFELEKNILNATDLKQEDLVI